MPAVPLKLKNSPPPERAHVLQHEVAVQQHRLHFGQQVVVRGSGSVQRVCTTPTFGSAKKWTVRCQEIRGRDEIGVEDGHELAGGGLQAILQGAGLVAVAVGAVDGTRSGGPAALYSRHQALRERWVSSVESSSTWICSSSRG